MNKHQCIIGIGSNYEAAHNMNTAITELKRIFADIIFSTIQQTEPIDMPNDYIFSNCAARFTCTMDREKITLLLKEIEKKCGRNKEEKAKGIIKMDIDLIVIDESILKPIDMTRNFIKKGLKELEKALK